MLRDFQRNPAECLRSIAHDYGDLSAFRLGSQSMYLLNRPEYIPEILIANQQRFRKSRIIQRAKVLLGEGLLTSEGPFHLRQRRLMQPSFHRPRIAAYGDVMSSYAMRAQGRWRDGAVIDVSEEMMRLTLAVVARTLFDADVESGADEIGEALTNSIGMFHLLLIPFSEVIQRLPLPAVRRFERAREVLDRTIFRIIDERRKSGEDKGDLLSMLLLAQDEDDGGVMTDKQVRDEALTLFLAGHETTANALTWTWYLLSQNPEAERLLHQELAAVLGGRAPLAADLPELRYTETVFAESMRLYPPAWTIGRQVLEDFKLDGYTVPTGSICLISPYVLHRDPRWYPEPERFEPSRWTAEAKEQRPKYAYLPFGAGPRMCIGERFAWMEGILSIAAMAQHWRLKLVPGHPIEIQPQITLRSKHGMRMSLVARTDA